MPTSSDLRGVADVVEYGRANPPPTAHSQESSISEESIECQGEVSGPESPSKSDSAHVSPARFSRLSLQKDELMVDASAHAEPHRSPSLQGPANKRAKPSPGKREDRESPSPIPLTRGVINRAQRTRAATRNKKTTPVRTSRPPEEDDPLKRKLTRDRGRVDSGYVTGSSRENTFNQKLNQPNRVAFGRQRTIPLPAVVEASPTTSVKGANRLSTEQCESDPVMIREPKSTPISQDQLAAEVRGIYASLVVVEARCIGIDSDQAANPNAYLDREQNQTVIALHRTLLYEHHDFLMATQYPSSTPGLRGLAAKYSMPARMWKHGIHAYLEVLRHRRPESQEFMMTFIYLAYQMMALLYETVPAFTDTWIECLGDLARYRMAIEEEREIHGLWGVIAGGWYSMAVDRHADIGRLNHHLGILERPSLFKLFLYSKSLTCVVRFLNAKGSLTTLCAPIVRDEAMHNGSYSAEARLVTYHAMEFMKAPGAAEVASEALNKLDELPLPKLKEIGIFLIVTNISALLELGTETNNLWLLFATQVGGIVIPGATMQSALAAGGEATTEMEAADTTPPATVAASSVIGFSYSCFNLQIRPRRNWQTCYEALPSVHGVLIWFHSLHTLRLRLNESSDTDLDWYHTFFSADLFAWATLADFLNVLVDHEPIKPHITQHAIDGTFPTPDHEARPLNEDHKIRGLIWTQFIFPPGWFDKQIDEDEKYIENSMTEKARVERVQWLGLYLALHTDYLDFNKQTNHFSAPVTGPTPPPIRNDKTLPLIAPSKPRSEHVNRPLQTAERPVLAPKASPAFKPPPNLRAKGIANRRPEAPVKSTDARHDHMQVKIVGEEDGLDEWEEDG